MKKFILSALALLLAGGTCIEANAQELTKEQKAALKAEQKAFSGFLKEAKKKSTTGEGYTPDVAAARAAIAEAAKSPLAKDNAEFYLQAGKVETAAWTEAAQKSDYPAYAASAKAGFDYYKKAYNAANGNKGIITEAQQGAFNLYQNTDGLAMIGNVYYQQEDFKSCLEAWAVAKTAFNEPVLTSNPLAAAILPKYAADSTINNLALNSYHVAQYMMQDTVAAIKELLFLKDRATDDVQRNQVLQSLALDYYALDDTLAFEAVLKEGVEKLPNEAWYVNNLINVYVNRGDLNSAATFLDKALEKDADNVVLVNMKGNLLEQQGNVEEALTYYEKALALDPASASVNSSLGRYYYNRALVVEDEYYGKKKFDEGDRQAAPLYAKALPYYENAFAFDTERKDKGIAVALRTLYGRQIAKGGATKQTFVQKYNEVSEAYGFNLFGAQ